MFAEVTPCLKGKIEAQAGIGSNPYEPGCGAYLDYEAARRSTDVRRHRNSGAGAMIPAEFRARLKALGLTMREFCARTGVHVTTASYWGRERPGNGMQSFPAWVPLLLAAWERTHPQPK